MTELEEAKEDNSSHKPHLDIGQRVTVVHVKKISPFTSNLRGLCYF
jgi:ribosomal protein L13